MLTIYFPKSSANEHIDLSLWWDRQSQQQQLSDLTLHGHRRCKMREKYANPKK